MVASREDGHAVKGIPAAKEMMLKQVSSKLGTSHRLDALDKCLLVSLLIKR